MIPFFSKKVDPTWERIVEGIDIKGPMISSYYMEIMSKILLLNEYDKEQKVILVTSAADGEGKTTTAVNLAAVLAEKGKKTLLMDVTPENSLARDIFAVPESLGLADVLTDRVPREEAVFQDQRLPHLFLFPSGSREKASIEMYLSQRFSGLMKELKSLYEFVIIDGPSVEKSMDPLVLSKFVDGVVLVILCDKTPKDRVLHAKRKIEQADGKIIGAVLNRIPRYVPKRFF